MTLSKATAMPDRLPIGADVVEVAAVAAFASGGADPAAWSTLEGDVREGWRSVARAVLDKLGLREERRGRRYQIDAGELGPERFEMRLASDWRQVDAEPAPSVPKVEAAAQLRDDAAELAALIIGLLDRGVVRSLRERQRLGRLPALRRCAASATSEGEPRG